MCGKTLKNPDGPLAKALKVMQDKRALKNGIPPAPGPNPVKPPAGTGGIAGIVRTGLGPKP